jgi:mannose-6-phosphate isomerase-like protein (cupin superfamily)
MTTAQPRRRFSPRAAVIALALVVTLTFECALAAENEARVTALIRDVKLLPEDEQPRAATLNETVHDDTAVRTGSDSRSELTFVDLTITRLGANTIFSFSKGGRSVQLNSGAMLLRVPKDSGGANLKTNACSVAIEGTTIALETTRLGRDRLRVLEGSARMSLDKQPGEWVRVGAGQMLDVPPGATHLPRVRDFDINRFMNKNPLITDFPPLPSRDLIYAAAANPPERVYTSQPVGAGPVRTVPPFRRPPYVPPSSPSGGNVATNTSTGGNATNPGGTHKPKKPLTPNSNVNPNANQSQPTGKLGGAVTKNKQSKPKPTPHKKKSPTPPPQIP